MFIVVIVVIVVVVVVFVVVVDHDVVAVLVHGCCSLWFASDCYHRGFLLPLLVSSSH